MKITIIKPLALTILFAGVYTLPGMAYSAPAGNNQLSVQTGLSKRTGETAFSYFVSWGNDDIKQREINGLTFIKGTSMPSPSSADDVAYKITKAINAAVNYQSPHDRGAIAKQNNSKVLVRNTSGFDLTKIAVRDYSNQELHYAVPGKTFKQASMNMSIDLVYSAAVEYVAGFSTGIKQETAGGYITVKIDNSAPIKIKTDGKTTKQLELELAEAIGAGADFSSSPMTPNFVQLRSKNYKSFDGGEIQIPALSARSIMIDVNDSGLGVLTKFKFTSVNSQVQESSKIPYILGLLFFGLLGYWFFYRKPQV